MFVGASLSAQSKHQIIYMCQLITRSCVFIGSRQYFLRYQAWLISKRSHTCIRICERFQSSVTMDYNSDHPAVTFISARSWDYRSRTMSRTAAWSLFLLQIPLRDTIRMQFPITFKLEGMYNSSYSPVCSVPPRHLQNTTNFFQNRIWYLQSGTWLRVGPIGTGKIDVDCRKLTMSM